jgi:hypothetical protein
MGEMTELSIDTKKRAVRLRLALRGEAEPIEVVIEKYQLTRRGDHLMLTVKGATSSREWVSALLREVMVGRSIVVPEKMAAVLNVLA